MKDDFAEPLLFSKLSIVLFSFIGSTLYGAILYSMNLRAIGKNKIAFTPILFALAYHVIIHNILARIGLPPLLEIATLNLGGGLILALVFWKEHIDPDIQFIKRAEWGPLLALLLLYGFFLSLYFFL